MKKFYYSLFATATMLLATTSCSQDEELVQQSSGNVTTFKVELQSATGSRAAGDGQTVNILYYEVHQNGKIVKDESKAITEDGKVSVDIPLLKGEEYDIIFWAQNSNSIYNAADLTNIQLNYDQNTKANQEAYDAFFNALVDFKATSNVTTVQLRRPFAQLNIGTIESDWSTAEGMIGGTDAPVTASEVTVKGLATNFNALTGLAAGERDVTFHQNALLTVETNGVKNVETFEVKTKKSDDTEVINEYCYLAMNYLLVPGTKAPQGLKPHVAASETEVIKTNTDITATFWRGSNELFSLEIPNVTIQRNYRTNIYGTLLAENKTFEIEVVDEFDGNHNMELTTVSSDQELEQALRQDKENIVVDLAEGGRATGKTYSINISANNSQYYWGTAKTKTITINANGNTINFIHNNSDWNYIRCVNDDAKWIINDAYFTNSKYNEGDWSRHMIRFYNAVELNNVISDKGIVIYNDGKLEDVKISDVNAANSDMYALWIYPHGQTVDINNCEFTADATKTGDRGITINNCYLDEDEVGDVVLNISNSKFNTQKKAAILYKDNEAKGYEGAEFKATINWLEGNDISGVAADPVNAVWIDEESENFINNVTVNGASVVVEGTTASNIVKVSTADGLKAAINNANGIDAEEATTIYLAEGTYTGAFVVNAKKVLLTSAGNATIDGMVYGCGSAHIALNNLIITNANPVESGLDGNNAKTSYYCLGSYAADWLIENCVFNVSNQGNAAGKGAINIYGAHNAVKQNIDGTLYELIIKNTVFNCNGERPIRARSNTYIEGCTFNDQYRYAVQIGANNQVSAETVTFIDNKIVNPCQTSQKLFAAGVQISGSYECKGVTFNISGNTMQSNKFINLLYVYDDEEDIDIESCTVNGATFISESNAEKVASTTVLKTVEDLISFANAVNGGKNNFSGKTVELGANIDLKGIDWEPIGQTGDAQFLGTFDGKNFIISNLSVNSEDEKGQHYSSGLFGWLNNATIKNVKVEGATINGHHNCGVIAGYMETSGCTIESCEVTNATVSCTNANDEANGDKAGVIVGHAGNTGVVVKNCIASNSTVSAARDAGQIAGAAKEVNVTNCTATNVTVKNNNTGTGANIRNEVIGRVLQ